MDKTYIYKSGILENVLRLPILVYGQRVISGCAVWFAGGRTDRQSRSLFGVVHITHSLCHTPVLTTTII